MATRRRDQRTVQRHEYLAKHVRDLPKRGTDLHYSDPVTGYNTSSVTYSIASADGSPGPFGIQLGFFGPDGQMSLANTPTLPETVGQHTVQVGFNPAADGSYRYCFTGYDGGFCKRQARTTLAASQTLSPAGSVA